MSNKLLLTIASAAAVAAMSMTAAAAPLAPTTILGITQGVGSFPNVPCPTGSCFGMEVAPGFVVWTDYGPGTDGGIVVGKSQASGGQETGPSAAILTPGEMTNAWLFFGNMGTFYSVPGGDTNLFDDVACAGAACTGKSELKVFHVAWNGNIIPMGSAAGCSLPACTPEQVAGNFTTNYAVVNVDGGAWSMHHSQVVPSGGFLGVKFQTFLRGTVKPGIIPNNLPTAANVSISGLYDVVLSWTPAVADVDGDPVTCRIGTPAANGVATVTSNCSSGTYRADVGFVGIDTFTYIPNDGKTPGDGAPGTVTAAITAPSPTATFTPTATSTPTATTTFTATATATPTATNSATYTATATSTVTNTATFTPTFTPVVGTSPTPTYTATSTPTRTSTSTATYTATMTNTATVTPTRTATSTFTPTYTATPTNTPGSNACTDLYPMKQVTVMGKKGHLKVVVTGNIIKANSNGKEIKICPTTTASYEASTNTAGATAVCKLKSHRSRGKGDAKVNDHLKCTDKPVGSDKVHIKIKSGVKERH